VNAIDATIDEARLAVRLIMERGYNRGRPLADQLEELLRSAPRG
jgi:hypothetical protein